MEIERYVMGPLATNTYFLVEGDELLIIDPAGKSEKVIEKIGTRKPLAVLLTHGHFDHIKAVDGLYEKYHLPVYLHEDDELLARDKYQGADFNIFNFITCPSMKLKEGTMEIGPFVFEVIFTPGHTKGSVLYCFGKDIFTGDTLFKGSVGRTDLKGGSKSDLMMSLRIFKKMDSDSILYPGHDEKTTLSEELDKNPYL